MGVNGESARSNEAQGPGAIRDPARAAGPGVENPSFENGLLGTMGFNVGEAPLLTAP